MGEPNKSSFLLSRTPIAPSNILQFVLKVTKSARNSIKFGIIDKKFEFEEESSSNPKGGPNYVYYSGDSVLFKDSNT